MAILIERQRRMMPVGEIRIGDPKPEKGPGRPRMGFRFTSTHRHLLERVSEVYAGQITAWEKRHQLLTQTNSIQAYFSLAELASGDRESLTQYLEYRDEGGKLMRKCDGRTCSTWAKDGARISVPCLCAERGDERCKVRSYVSVILPHAQDIGVWTLRTGSQTFAGEIEGLIATAKTMMPGVNLIPVLLTITRRHKETAPGKPAGFYPVVTVSLDPNPVPISTMRDRVVSSLGLTSVPTALPSPTEGEDLAALPPAEEEAQPLEGELVEPEQAPDPQGWLAGMVGERLAEVAARRFGPGLAAFVNDLRAQQVDAEAIRHLITGEVNA